MNQINNPDYESIDPKDRKRAAIKLTDPFSAISAVLAVLAFVLSSDSFNVRVSVKTGVDYAISLIDVAFLVLLVSAVVFASVSEKTLLGKAAVQMSTITLVSAIVKFSSYIILGLAVNFKYLLPRLVFYRELGFNILFAFIMMLLCVIAIIVCNIISTRRNLAHKKSGSAVPYILMCTTVLLLVYPVIEDALNLNAYLIRTLLDTRAGNIIDNVSIINFAVLAVCVIAVILLGFFSEDEIRRFMCGVVTAMFTLGIILNCVASIYMESIGFFRWMNPVGIMLICFVPFVSSLILIFLSSKKFIKKN